MAEFTEALSYDFMRNALVAGVLASLLCGVVGTFAVAKRLVFASGGISHAAFGGLGLCHYLGIAPGIGALGAAVLCAVVLGYAGTERFRSREALIGVLWSVGMALGIVFVRATPGYAPDLMAILFGDILSVTNSQLAMMLAVDAAVLGIIALLFKEFVAVTFDEPFAAVQGVPVRLVLTVLLILVAISIVVSIQVVGIILVIALLSIPPLVGLHWVRDFKELLAVSVATSLAMTVAGLALSYRYDLPAGPAIILLGAGFLAATSALRAMRDRGYRRTPRRSDATSHRAADGLRKDLP